VKIFSRAFYAQVIAQSLDYNCKNEFVGKKELETF